MKHYRIVTSVHGLFAVQCRFLFFFWFHYHYTNTKQQSIDYIAELKRQDNFKPEIVYKD